MPLAAYGLCEALMTAAATPSAEAAHATPGVGSTPRSRTSAPSDASPAASAPSSMGPDSRVSRPTRKGPPSTLAPARPSATVNSGVSSTLATPRTPSVPNLSDRRRLLALGVLRRLAGLLQAVLLALLLTRIAGEKAGARQRDAHFGIESDEGSSDAETDRTGLAGDTAADDGGVDVVDLLGGGDLEGLAQHHA